MKESIVCNEIINNKNDRRYNKVCSRTLAIKLDDNTIELKCPICKRKKIIKFNQGGSGSP